MIHTQGCYSLSVCIHKKNTKTTHETKFGIIKFNTQIWEDTQQMLPFGTGLISKKDGSGGYQYWCEIVPILVLNNTNIGTE